MGIKIDPAQNNYLDVTLRVALSPSESMKLVHLLSEMGYGDEAEILATAVQHAPKADGPAES